MTPSRHARPPHRLPQGPTVMALVVGLVLLGLQAGPALAHPDHHQPTQQGQHSSHQGQNSTDHGHDHEH